MLQIDIPKVRRFSKVSQSIFKKAFKLYKLKYSKEFCRRYSKLDTIQSENKLVKLYVLGVGIQNDMQMQTPIELYEINQRIVKVVGMPLNNIIIKYHTCCVDKSYKNFIEKKITFIMFHSFHILLRDRFSKHYSFIEYFDIWYNLEDARLCGNNIVDAIAEFENQRSLPESFCVAAIKHFQIFSFVFVKTFANWICQKTKLLNIIA